MWNFHIKTAGNASLPLPSKSGAKSGEVSIVVYGSNATKGPIELSGRDRQVLLRGKVDHYEVIFADCLYTTTSEPPRGKTNNVVCEQVRHKPTCTVAEKR